MLLTRTAAAFQFTAERLAASVKELYFWTFTFKSVPIADEYAMEDFAILRNRMHHEFPWLQGVRVCELHRSHGIHFHLLLNGRIPIRRLRMLFFGNGHLIGRQRYLDFGRLSVTKCDVGTIAYMAKYLTKQYRSDNAFEQRRRWGTFGGFKQTKCKDIEYDTPFHRNQAELFQGRKVSFITTMLVSHYSALWGSLADWPQEYKIRLMDFTTTNKNTHERDGHKDTALENSHTDAILFKGHLEMCNHCKYRATEEGYCQTGWALWQRYIWQGAADQYRRQIVQVEQEIKIQNAYESILDVTPCNKSTVKTKRVPENFLGNNDKVSKVYTLGNRTFVSQKYAKLRT